MKVSLRKHHSPLINVTCFFTSRSVLLDKESFLSMKMLSCLCWFVIRTTSEDTRRFAFARINLNCLPLIDFLRVFVSSRKYVLPSRSTMIYCFPIHYIHYAALGKLNKCSFMKNCRYQSWADAEKNGFADEVCSRFARFAKSLIA